MSFFDGWTPKDWITFLASIFALLFAFISYRQKISENKNALRKQFTDVIERLSDLKFEIAEFGNLHHAEAAKLPDDYVIFKNDQRRFFVRQAIHLVRRIPKLVSRFEYLLIAEASDAVDEFTQAEIFYKRATRRSLFSKLTGTKRVERGIALRNYARYLYVDRQDFAERKFREALAEFAGDNDRLRSNRARTYEIWAEAAAERDPAAAGKLLDRAIAEYQRFDSAARRTQATERVNKKLRPRYGSPDAA
jgi:hypothetical protein